MTFVSQIIIAHGLTCNEVLEFPDSKKLSLAELQTLQPQETVQCLAHLGKERLLKEEADYIWQSIVTFFSGIANVPESVMILLHWVTPALTPDDYYNLTLSNVDVIQNFGFNYGLEEDQLAAIADRVREDFAGKEPEDYTFYDLIALRQILCAFNQSEIERIHPAAYREAAGTIGKLENCKPEVMQGFANLAVQPRAFGPPARWPETLIHTLGKVTEYLPQDVMSRFNKADT
ncbi:unnamed protein product [Chilo suppressalis]|uniref:Uncharacterized protein n=1 Tax=Chilo suppressalis TaxID=168631 RepID=A0ABN8B4W3_CHISP|nr:unnamed protein product [Chilo suppressalis]